MQHRYVKNFLSSELCDKIIEKYNDDSLLFNPLIYDSNKNLKYDSLYNKRKINYLDDNDCNELMEVTDLLSKYIEREIKKISLKYKNIRYTFNKYKQGDFLNYHFDEDEVYRGALYTFVLELNEDYVGGEFIYKNENDLEVVNDKSKGGLFMFDSTITHKVNPIIEGTRFSLNCWPKLNKIKTLI